MSVILSVRQLTDAIRQNLEGRFPYVWVRGEVTNLARPSSGHLYFGLRDSDALLRCVWFRKNQRDQEAFDPLTGEIFEGGPRPSLARSVRNGQQIICAGRLRVHAPRGDYQLVVDLGQDSGEGALFLELEELKRRLSARGYFSLERKRPLPSHPQRVTVLTAPAGAAIHDFLRLSSRRGTGFELRIRPVPVQGDQAPPQIAEAIRRENEVAWAEVLVLIRGGGSLQDLWAFNDERVADAIFASGIPVLAGIGHEVDTSLADMVADVRAATPSHAAQLLWEEREWYAQRMEDLALGLHGAFKGRFSAAERILDRLERTLFWFSPTHSLDRQQERLNNLEKRLNSVWHHRADMLMARLSLLETAILRKTVLPRYQSYMERLADLAQRIRPAWKDVIAATDQRHSTLATRLETAWQRDLAAREHALDLLELKLAAHDPGAPLSRGRAFVLDRQGHFIRSVRELSPGTGLRLRMHDGDVDVHVDAVHATGD